MIYSLLFTLAFLLATPVVLLLPKLRRKYLATFKQRLGGGLDQLNPEKEPAIWLHAVSVGEALAAKSLVVSLRAEFPGYRILVSTTTTTGQEIARKHLNADGFFYFPYDWKFAVRRSLRRTGARLCVVMETELWPNFVRTLHGKGIPLVLANGRISDRSFKRYRRYRWFFKPLLRRFFRLCAQSKLDAERLVQIGARPFDTVITGNLKYHRDQFEVDPDVVRELRHRIVLQLDEDLFVAGSTHEGEEEACLDAFERARHHRPYLRLALVPRKPERFDAVAEMLKQRGVPFGRISKSDEPIFEPVILVDTIGMLAPLYQLAHVALVGGSLVPRGGHNLLEASAAGVPVIFGPHTHNFRGVTDDVLRHNAGVRVNDNEDLAETLEKLLSDEAIHQQMADGAVEVINSNQDAVPKTIEQIREAMAWSGLRLAPPAWTKTLAWLHASGAGILRGDPKKELEKAEKLEKPVISVGGLSFGGAGKTPMVSFFAQRMLEKKLRPALITRGYKGKGKDPFIVSDGNEILADAGVAGDEAVMLAKRHPGLIVIKDADRLRGGKLASEEFDPDIILLDDGFQHRRLGRDFNLLMLDADSIIAPRWGGQLLREPLDFAQAADAIVLLGMEQARTDAAGETLLELHPNKLQFKAHYVIESCRRLDSKESVPLDEVRTRKLLALCGIGVPARFTHSLAHSGFRVTHITHYPDHHSYTPKDLAEVLRTLKLSGADAIIATEKDEQRLLEVMHYLPHDLDVFIAVGSLHVEQADELFELMLLSL